MSDLLECCLRQLADVEGGLIPKSELFQREATFQTSDRLRQAQPDSL